MKFGIAFLMLFLTTNIASASRSVTMACEPQAKLVAAKEFQRLTGVTAKKIVVTVSNESVTLWRGDLRAHVEGKNKGDKNPTRRDLVIRFFRDAHSVDPSGCKAELIFDLDATKSKYLSLSTEMARTPFDEIPSGIRFVISAKPLMVKAGTTETAIFCPNHSPADLNFIKIEHEAAPQDRTLTQFAVTLTEPLNSTYGPAFICEIPSRPTSAGYEEHYHGIVCVFEHGMRAWPQNSIRNVTLWITAPGVTIQRPNPRFTPGDIQNFLNSCSGGRVEIPETPKALAEVE